MHANINFGIELFPLDHIHNLRQCLRQEEFLCIGSLDSVTRACSDARCLSIAWKRWLLSAPHLP